ncbi:MAG: TetR/AcrR family transcriptional regulator, partial [Candidatus Binatia bacterium]
PGSRMGAAVESSRKKPTRRAKGAGGSYEEKRRAALEVAARAFNERGFYRTSLDDIAARLNVTKPALYYYFESKDEILFECHSAAIQSLVETPLGDGAHGELSGLEKIELLVRRYVSMIVKSFGRCLVLVGTQPLEPANARKCRDGRRQTNELLVGLIKEAVADGSIPKCDPKLSAFFVFGMLNWIAQWYDPKGARSLDEIADEAVRFVRGALTQPKSRASSARVAARAGR